ncbi:MAG: ABC transporter ATP-binding protein [Alphaproteobacteria bacterium]|nr:ABC transporter ATP-binding protein [Alphaproteobacteria bacterium]
MLRISGLTYRVAGRVLLDRADVAIDDGHHVGFVGRNGTGKTTLLRLIAGELEPETGRIERPSRARLGMTSQEAPNSSDSLVDTVLAADRELARLTAAAEAETDAGRLADLHEGLTQRGAHHARARAARLLAGLGFDAAAQGRPCRDFSGGWRMRVALASLLFTEPDLLLLDEPTNHLDLEATLWLEDYLRRYPGMVLLVSHDRDLLNRVVGEILHLEHKKLTLYRGDYDRFEATRRMRLELDAKRRTKQEHHRAHLQKFVDRFRYKASKSRQAQSRLKMLAKLEPIPELHDEGMTRFEFPEPDAVAPPLYSLDQVSVGYDGKAVLSGLSLRIDDDDRIALLGANGNGKSTLAKLLAGRLQPLAGEIHRSSKVKVGYFAQHQAEELDLTATPVIELGRRRPKASEEQLRSQLGRFGFSQTRADTKVSDLSGGEKARLLFALMMLDRPNILLFDEPTNHLDMVARQALVEAINDYPGAVILISHDPHLIELTADRLWLVADGAVRPFEGDLEDYRALVLRAERGNGATRSPEPGADRREERRRSAERRQQLAPMRRRLGELEKAVTRIDAERVRLEREMADPSVHAGGPAKLVDLQKRLGLVRKDLADAENDWLTLHEALEKAAADA